MSNVLPMKPCLCCAGTGTVEGITGAERPCSRCQYTAFHNWYRGVVQVDRERRRADEAPRMEEAR